MSCDGHAVALQGISVGFLSAARPVRNLQFTVVALNQCDANLRPAAIIDIDEPLDILNFSGRVHDLVDDADITERQAVEDVADQIPVLAPGPPQKFEKNLRLARLGAKMYVRDPNRPIVRWVLRMPHV